MGGVKVVAGTCCLDFSHLPPHLPHFTSSSSAPHTLASVFSSISSSAAKNTKRRGSIDSCSDRATLSYHARRLDQRPAFFGTTSTKLCRRKSLNEFIGRSGRLRSDQILRRAISACSFADNGDEEKFVRQLEELASELRREDSNELEAEEASITSFGRRQEHDSPFSAVRNPISHLTEPPWPAVQAHPSCWVDQDEIMPANLEMKANSMDLPLSLRMIKRKKKTNSKWDEGFREAGESACCSVKKAFSSMVFIIRELHSYTLQMREILFYENLQGILVRVQEEMNASFVWLFQQIFSSTPTLMVYVMLLLANFTVYSIGHNPAAIAAASAAASPNPQAVVAIERQDSRQTHRRFDSSSVKSYSVGRAAFIGGSGSGGGKVKPVAGATDDGGQSDGIQSSSQVSHAIVPNATSTASPATVTERAAAEEEAAAAWNRIVEEATRMKASSRDESLMDPDTLQQLVSMVTVELEPEDQSRYAQAELMYHLALSQDPENGLLLSNFAQFIFLVLRDYDRAEYYFKRATRVKPADAEAFNRYANFLWLGRKDLEAAEETYLEAIAADPSNPYYAANYAHFLWNTGAEDTCYPPDGRGSC